MNKYTTCLFLTLLFLCGACAPKVRPNYTAEVNFLYKESNEVFSVSSVGYGSNKADAIQNAQKSAFTVVIFRGVPGSDVTISMVENESDARSKHSSYFKKFYDEGRYKSFMLHSEETSDLSTENGQKKITIKVKINHSALRKDLELNQVIRKFGF